MTDEREQERLRAALREAAEPGSRGIDVAAVTAASRRRRRPRVALAGGALAVALVASGAGLAGGLLPQDGTTSASDTADEPVQLFESEGSGTATDGSAPSSGAEDGQPRPVDGADVCAPTEAALAADRGILISTPAELGRDGSTAVAIGGGDAALRGEVLVESIALLDGGRVVAVLLGADGATPLDVEPGGTAMIDVQGALIGCGDGPPASGAYEAVATVQLIGETGGVRTLRSAAAPIALD
jgi:hypothetical protein